MRAWTDIKNWATFFPKAPTASPSGSLSDTTVSPSAKIARSKCRNITFDAHPPVTLGDD